MLFSEETGKLYRLRAIVVYLKDCVFRGDLEDTVSLRQ